MCSGQEERESVIYLTEPKQNDPTHISAPTNLQFESRGLSTQEIIASIKQFGKNGYEKECNEKCICCFFTI